MFISCVSFLSTKLSNLITVLIYVQAALEAIDELDVFGSRGGPGSIIHVQADCIQYCKVSVNIYFLNLEIWIEDILKGMQSNLYKFTINHVHQFFIFSILL